MPNHKNNAKFAFYYMLSLVALLGLSMGMGQVIFQIINSLIPDTTQYANGFSPELLTAAISSLIISIPLYFLTAWQIEKNLRAKELDTDSGIRRWLIYFILFVSSVVAIVWLMITIGSFLDGEFTSRFIFKALTAIIISGAIFGYYFYDMRRKDIRKNDSIVRIYFIAALVLTIGSLAAGFFFADSPAEARARKHDEAVLSHFTQIDSEINTYFSKKDSLPDNLQQVIESSTYMTKSMVEDPQTGRAYEYKKTGVDTFELCAEFQTKNTDQKDRRLVYSEEWPHDAGYQCLKQKAADYGPLEEAKPLPR